MCGDTKIYLRLTAPDLEFKASNGSIMVAIPIAIWEVIRQKTTANYDWADKTDTEIRDQAETVAADNVASYEAEKEYCVGKLDHNGRPRRPFSELWGWDKPLDEQIARGVEVRTKWRAEAIALRAKVAELEAQGKPRASNLNLPSSPPPPQPSPS